MAAVAGSKGKIATACEAKPIETFKTSFQASIVAKLIGAEIDCEAAIEEMMLHCHLREVGVDTNMMCNLHCRYCYLDDRPVRKGELGVADWVELLTPLAKAGCKLFAFIGKEPLLDDIAIGVLHKLNTLRTDHVSFRTGMVTNGTQLHRHAERLLDANLSYLDVSLDGLPEVNDVWRGHGVATAVLTNVANYLRYSPQHDMFVSCVLHKGNHAHVRNFANHVFNLGVKGFFTSPVLKFTRNQNIQDWAITPTELNVALENLIDLAHDLQLTEERQIIVDLPYRYAWFLMASGQVAPKDIYEDRYEVPFWQPDTSLPVFVKMNVLSYSHWKAVRITHDGTIISNLDMAAHQEYSLGADRSTHEATWANRFPGRAARKFHWQFLTEHLRAMMNLSDLYDRAVAMQHRFQQAVNAN